MPSRWFCKVLGQEVGPVSFPEMAEMVRSGTLKEGDPVRREGASDWIRAREVIGLFRAAARKPAAAAPEAEAEPKPAQPAGKTKEAEPPPAEPPRIGRRQLLLAGGLVLGLLLLVVGVSAWRASRRERFPEPYQGPREPVKQDVLAPLAADRSTASSVAVPKEPVPQPVDGETGNWKERFTQDFREDFETQSLDFVGGSPPEQYYSLEPAGLRMTVPENCPENYFAANARITLNGDFQITARYTILNMEPPTSGFGTGVALSVSDAEEERAAVWRQHGVREGHVFASYRGKRRPDKSFEHLTEFRETSSDALSGWLRLTRVGKNIRYEIAGPHNERFVQIHEEEFPGEDVRKIRLVIQTGGSPTALDAVWSYLDVQAEELVKHYSPAKGPKT